MNKEKMMACARGRWQRQIVEYLYYNGKITNPISWLQGTAKSYSRHYERSFRNLIHRLETEAGMLKSAARPARPPVGRGLEVRIV